MSDNSHAAMCIYCGEHVIYDTRQVTDMEAAHRQLVEHDQQCPKNPLVAKLAAAEQRADREATGFQAMCEAFERLEEIVGLDTGGGMGPGPALNAAERIVAERDALASRLKQVKRPDNCRNELQAQGKSYPRSGCAACGNGGLAGCPYETHGAALAKRKDS